MTLNETKLNKLWINILHQPFLSGYVYNRCETVQNNILWFYCKINFAFDVNIVHFMYLVVYVFDIIEMVCISTLNKTFN